jgi:7-cyano-7-deazaguanine synthase
MTEKEKDVNFVVALSGGADSTTTLALIKHIYPGNKIQTISFSYGSKHPEELVYARKQAEIYKVPNLTIVIDPIIYSSSSSTLLEGRDEVVKNKTYAEIIAENGEGSVDTYVPGRNTLFSAYALSVAESLAGKKGKAVIALGQHADDAAGAAYPDCSLAFAEAFEKVAQLSSEGRVTYYSPFIEKSKAFVIAVGKELGVDFNETLSCYEPIKGKACGICATCLDRKKAMEGSIRYGAMAKAFIDNLIKYGR